jgi:hypothetical protein
MPRIDDFKQAREISWKELSSKEIDSVSRFSGAAIREDEKGKKGFTMNFLNRTLLITWPDIQFSYKEADEEVPIQHQVLLLHYLNGAVSSGGTRPTGEWISFQDVPDGRFYMDAFIKRAKDPLLRTFGDKPERMTELTAKVYQASPLDYGDHSVTINALPLIRVALVLWEGDEEFPPDGNILFDRNIIQILSAEDIAWLAGMIVYPLMRMAR